MRLKSNVENYYMVGNEINRKLICYLLYQSYGVYYDYEDIIYSIHIIDHAAKLVSLTEKECIVFSKDDYKVYEVYEMIYIDESASNTIIESEDICDSDSDSDSDSKKNEYDDMPELENIFEKEHLEKEDVEHITKKMDDFQNELEELKKEIKELFDEDDHEDSVERIESVGETIDLLDSETRQNYEIIEFETSEKI